jgi:hypothetical protein
MLKRKTIPVVGCRAIGRIFAATLARNDAQV